MHWLNDSSVFSTNTTDALNLMVCACVPDVFLSLASYVPQDVDARMCMSKNTDKKLLTKQSLAESDRSQLEVMGRDRLVRRFCQLAPVSYTVVLQ